MTLKHFAAAGLALAISASALAQAIGKPEDNIRWRQSAYHTMAWNMGRIKANIEGSYNKEQVVQAANTIAAIANSGLGNLFPAGTDKGKGWKDTRVKAELFTDKEGVGKVASAFNKEANDMAKVAAGGDLAAIKTQFKQLGDACGACHDKFRQKD